MDARQREALLRRLVANPQDQAAIAEAHAAGQQDPEGYARLLEQIGIESPSGAVASHWLNEAATVWFTTFQDAERGASVLLTAVERDPTNDELAERVASMYQADPAGHVALIERRATALGALAHHQPEWRSLAAALFVDTGRLLSEGGAPDPNRAKQAYAHAVDLDPANQFAIYSLRELHKAAGEYAEALPYFGMEVALTQDSQRRLALYLDEAEVAKSAGRQDRAIGALRQARRLNDADPGLRQQLGTLILDKYRQGAGPSADELAEGAELFVALAETYPGEHGFLYSLCALELVATNDRAMQLSIYYGEQLGRLAEVAPLAAGYLRDNPAGVLAADAARVAGNAAPLPQPARAVAHEAAHRPESALRAAPDRPAVAQRQAPAQQVPEGLTVDGLLEKADSLAKKSRKNEAIAVYRQALDLDPVNAEALNYLQEQLPHKRKFGELKDVLLAAIDHPGAQDDDRVGWLRELAAISETQLRDMDLAVYAWQRIIQLDPQDDEGRDQFKRLLEKARRWDDLARLLQTEAGQTEDLEVRISLEKNLAKLHSGRRKDNAAAGEAWARIAALSPGDEAALMEAVKLLESSGRADLAADCIAENVAALDDDLAKRELYFKLAELRVARGQALEAAEALSEGAEELGDGKMWERAEQLFAQAQAWEPAANAADEQAKIADDDVQKAALLARAAGYWVSDGDSAEAMSRLEEAVSLQPTNDEYSGSLEQLLIAAGQVDELVQMLLTRATAVAQAEVRVYLRKRAAAVQRDTLGDADAARSSYALVLRDVEDEESLGWLATEAEARGDIETAAEYFARWGKVAREPAEKVRLALHEAELAATKLMDIDRAADRYEYVLRELEPTNTGALESLGDLEIARGNYEHGADVLERYLNATSDRKAKIETAARLAEIHELNLSNTGEAIRLLQFVHAEDPNDLDATHRLCELAESAEQWALVAEVMVELIAVESDQAQISEMTRRLAQILRDKLGNGAEALNALGGVADQGDEPCREAFIELGDQLGDKALVARRIVHWCSGSADSIDPQEQAARAARLHAAFDRFAQVDAAVEAIAVAKDLVAHERAEPRVAPTFERLAVAAQDTPALRLAHALGCSALRGPELAVEYVRQAEVLVKAGVPFSEAVQHGETALAEASSDQIEGLLSRLAHVCDSTTAKVDVYERQIARLETIPDRVAALVRAAEFAASLDDRERSASLFDVALSGGLEEDLLDTMADLVGAADERRGDGVMRKLFATALSEGGQAARDGGQSRGRMLRMAAELAFRRLSDPEQAFIWLGDSLVLHVDDVSLDALEEMAAEAQDFRRAEAVLTRALDEVFDGPLVRRLLAKRATLREERLSDKPGAAEDLKRLHDLSPGDPDVNTQLERLYDELEEYGGMVALLEDQILRNRDTEVRSQLARKVALLWQDQLDDPREAADAWRRVLRLAPEDEEAKIGLARAKESMLQARRKQAEEESMVAAAIPEPPATSEATSKATPSQQPDEAPAQVLDQLSSAELPGETTLRASADDLTRGDSNSTVEDAEGSVETSAPGPNREPEDSPSFDDDEEPTHATGGGDLAMHLAALAGSGEAAGEGEHADAAAGVAAGEQDDNAASAPEMPADIDQGLEMGEATEAFTADESWRGAPNPASPSARDVGSDDEAPSGEFELPADPVVDAEAVGAAPALATGHDASSSGEPRPELLADLDELSAELSSESLEMEAIDVDEVLEDEVLEDEALEDEALEGERAELGHAGAARARATLTGAPPKRPPPRASGPVPPRPPRRPAPPPPPPRAASPGDDD